jgi:hypothetical protein
LERKNNLWVKFTEQSSAQRLRLDHCLIVCISNRKLSIYFLVSRSSRPCLPWRPEAGDVRWAASSTPDPGSSSKSRISFKSGGRFFSSGWRTFSFHKGDAREAGQCLCPVTVLPAKTATWGFTSQTGEKIGGSRGGWGADCARGPALHTHPGRRPELPAAGEGRSAQPEGRERMRGARAPGPRPHPLRTARAPRPYLRREPPRGQRSGQAASEGKHGAACGGAQEGSRVLCECHTPTASWRIDRRAGGARRVSSAPGPAGPVCGSVW